MDANSGANLTPLDRAILNLMEKTGYSMRQENGQRKFGGPPPNWEGPPPGRGCEIFIGKIPRDCFEDELVPALETVGKLYVLRLMMDFSGTNRGFAFAMYTNKTDAKRAVKEMNNYEIRQGHYLGVRFSVDNCRLFIGRIPKSKNREEILEEMNKVTEGVTDVIVYPSAINRSRNRGFAFVVYESHRAAAMARRKLIPGRFQLWGQLIAIDWAVPEQEVDDEVMSKVKVLYVRNLMLNTSEETILRAFSRACGVYGAIERVKKIKDYAFIHFMERDLAVRAMNAMNGALLKGSRIEVVLAKPVVKAQYHRYATNKSAFLSQDDDEEPTLMEAYGYSSQYSGAVGAGNPGAIYSTFGAPQQTFGSITCRTDVGIQGMMRGQGCGSPSLQGGRGAFNGCFIRTPVPNSAPQILEEVCQKHGLGSPSYELHSTLGREIGQEIQLFLFKVSIPALTTVTEPYQPNKLCKTVEEARNFAAEYVLKTFGINLDSADHYTGRPLTPSVPLHMPNGQACNTSTPADVSLLNANSMLPPPPPHVAEQFYHHPVGYAGPPSVSYMQPEAQF